MPRANNKLSQLAVTKTTKPGLYADGGNLYLQITTAGVKSWLFRYMRNGKQRGMGLGPLHTIGLAEARALALDCRRLLLAGTDPLDARNAERAAQQLARANDVSFQHCAEKYIVAHRAGWKNAKHAAQWTNTLATYAYPVFDSRPVSAIDTALVMRVLEPIWTTKTETASRLRGRIESVLDWATVRGYRSGENPARLKGHLDTLLPKRSRVQKVEHHPALPYADLPEFIKALRSEAGTAARALELLILTATRTNEVIAATWQEFDLDEGVWTIPAERMKMGKEHRVPLSPGAIAVVKAQQEVKRGDYVFPGARDYKPLSNMAMLQLLERMQRNDITVHGFRSTFRDWAGETTHYPREVCEAALAHGIKDKAEAAYARGDLFMKRAALMRDWADFTVAEPSPDA
ncbi:putative phage integrase [Burkholderia pseudomallei]|uniref:tyrosine-type recombinase/integrase n=1 Tax=Burkholderia pseudomallei TaxID=28450 RepID=UPI000F0959BE|nr:site-specific integrase [Burkholderia pseudomallei]CAJ3027091.1 putative phage integrase [Burkholderia pseudomallei]VCH22145.1 putative phage integrase [Burkholderia pseudomallei]VCH35428.1 putative phage integrase [Burkholderia pseudomallei]VCH48152.1 putative phage integrase [Burkholderia pseudomallei]VCH54860.1 putative phage integrase [Burkholderia pseudomallei]